MGRSLGIIHRAPLRRPVTSSIVRALSLCVALTLAVPAAAAPGFSDAEAQRLYDEGLERFEAGDFEGALERLDASIERERTTSALYAKAQSLNNLGRCREAVPIYNEIRSQVPANSEAGAVVKEALISCAEKMAQEDEEPDLASSVEPEPATDVAPIDEPTDEVEPASGKPRKRWYTDPYAPIFIGVGGVGVGVGAYFLSEASKENARQPDQYDEFAAKGERVRQLQIQGGVILGIGGALVLTGAIRYAVLGARDRKANVASVVPTWGHRWAGVSVSGRF